MTRRVSPIEFSTNRHFGAAGLNTSALLEGLAILALLGTLALLGLTGWQRSEPQVGGGVQLLTTDLLWVRSEAIRLDTPIRVTFDTDTNGYRVAYESSDEGAAPQLIFERALKRDFPLIKLVNEPASTQTVLFDSRGVPQGLDAAVKIEVASVDASFKSCVFVQPKGRVTYSRTCAPTS